MVNQIKTVLYKYRFLALMAVAISAMAIGAYFFLETGVDHKPAVTSDKVTIAYSATTDSVLAQVAHQRGYYLQEGLDATPHLHPYGKPALQEVLDGKADFATVAETPVMFEIMKGKKIAIIATIETSNRNSAIVARKDKGIFVPNDLKGKKIAATLGTTSDFFMDAFLTVHGISRKDMKVIDVKAGELQNALARGDVDAASAFTPYLNQAQKKLGNKGITFYDEEIYTFTFNVVATQEFIRRNPEKVNKMLRALIRAEEFAKQNPEETQKIVAEFSRMDIGMIREIIAVTNFNVSLDQSLVLAMEDESRWAMNNGFIARTNIPNYLDFIYFKGLESVNPEAVRILR